MPVAAAFELIGAVGFGAVVIVLAFAFALRSSVRVAAMLRMRKWNCWPDRCMLASSFSALLYPLRRVRWRPAWRLCRGELTAEGKLAGLDIRLLGWSWIERTISALHNGQCNGN